MRKRSICVLLCYSYFQCAAAASIDRTSAQELQLPDVRAELEHRSEVRVASEIVPLARPLDTSIQTAGPLLTSHAATEGDAGAISIDASLLTNVQPLPGTLAAGARSAPSAEPRDLSLTLDNQELIIRVIDTKYDPRYDLYHSTAIILNREQSYARFSFDQAGRIAGTLKLPNAKYRIVARDLRSQRIIRFTSPSADDTAVRNMIVKGGDSALARLELRHAQAQIIADLQPHTFMLARSNLNVLLRGDNLGKLAIKNINEAGLRSALLRLSPLTNANSATRLHISQVHRSANGNRIVQFEQVVHGIPINRRNELIIDPSGRIVSLNSSLLTEEIKITEVNLSEQEALRTALRAVQAKHRLPAEFQLLKPARLRYEIVDGGGAVEPIYTFFFSADPISVYEVRVNAHSSVSDVLPGTEQAIEIYRATSGAPVDGSSPGAQLVWGAFQPGVGSPCVAGYSVCSQYIPPKVAYNWSYYWNAAANDWNEAACCENLDIDIVANTTAAADGGEYRSASNSILFPASGNGANAQNPDGVLHELGHAYIDQYNVPGTVGTDQVSRAIREGLADTIAASYPAYEEEEIGWKDFDYGADWVVFDGQGAYAANAQRDLTVPRQWSYVATASNHHEAGKAIGNFFYRLKLGSMYSYPKDFVQFVQRVAKTIQDYEGDGSIDLLDLKTACIAAANGSSALITYINSTWSAMSQQQIPGSEVPAPPGAPNAPSGVISVATGCMNGFSTYSVHWNAPANTTYYVTYVKLPNSPAYGVSDRINAPQNWGYGYTNYNTDARIAACNGSGCSLMSATAAAMPHNQCGF